jgi:hypothetical protein
MTGSTNKLLHQLNRNLGTNEQIRESSLQKKHNDGLMETVVYLREQSQTRDIGPMLDDERLLLTHSLQFDANSPEEKNSLQSAIGQLDECRRSFNILTSNPVAYKETAGTYSSKKTEAGLPLDAAREFFKSHSTRLSNILSGKSSHYEKVLVRQRKDNLQVIREAYVELQRKALGLEAPQKKQALSR